MIVRTSAMTACAALLLVAAPLATAATCPDSLLAWRMAGEVGPGAEWSAGLLEIRGDVALWRDLVMRFDGGGPDAEQSRWFEVGAGPWPVGLSTRTRGVTGEELEGVCDALSGPELSALRDRSRPMCFVDEEANQKIVIRQTTSLQDGDDASGVPTLGRIGALFGDVESQPDEELPCRPIERMNEAVELGAAPPSDDEPAHAIGGVLDAVERRVAPVESGLAALPAARRILDVLRTKDGSRVPAELPSTLDLTLLVAPREYAEALALERLWSTDATDEEVALRRLGEWAGASAEPFLRIELRLAVARQRPRIASMTLRALLRADPGAARLAAVPLLAERDTARAALGVFALTDPRVADELADLDVVDETAVAAAAARLLDGLAASASEPELREAAEGVIATAQR